ncbi:MAG: hypothetical protein ACUZ8O_04090 [Candidatus Anammoxibacter sp.]
MKVKEILKIEKDNRSSIFLFKEGFFWRAYERSAFRFVRNIQGYSVIKRYIKCVKQDVVFIGFPLDNLNKIVKICENGQRYQFKQTAEGILEIDSFTDAENFEIWKEELNEVKQEKDYKSLIDKIREFPVANKTPVETIEFVMELQETVKDGVVVT